MANWGFKGVSKRKIPGARYFRKYLDSRIRDQLDVIGQKAVRYARMSGAPMETGALRLAQTRRSGISHGGPWLALGWDVTRLQRTNRQTWKKLGGPQGPRKPKGPGSAAQKGDVASLVPATAERSDGGLFAKMPRVGKGKFRTADGPGKWFDYGTYQYMGKDWRSGRRLHYRMGGTDHWYLKYMDDDNALMVAMLNRGLRSALEATLDKMWSYL